MADPGGAQGARASERLGRITNMAGRMALGGVAGGPPTSAKRIAQLRDRVARATQLAKERGAFRQPRNPRA